MGFYMNYNKEPKSLTSRRGSKASQVDIIYTTLKWSPSSTINGTLVEAVKEFEGMVLLWAFKELAELGLGPQELRGLGFRVWGILGLGVLS